MKISFTILGEPASKSNSRQIVHFGERLALIKSKKARRYEEDALLQIPPLARVCLLGPVRVTLRIFYASQRPDLDESVLLDVLQNRYKGKGERREIVQRGVYVNDRQVREKHVFHGIDRVNPRAEIEVEPIEQAQASMFGDDLIEVQPRPRAAKPPLEYGDNPF